MFALLLAAGVALAARNTLPFTISLMDQSPLLNFYATGNDASGAVWNSSFSRSPWETHTEGQAGMGASWHHYNTSALPPNSNARVGMRLTVEVSEIVVWGDKDGSPPPNGSIVVEISESEEASTVMGGGNKSTVPAAEGVKLSPGQLARLTNLASDQELTYDFLLENQTSGVYNVRKVDVIAALSSDAESADQVPLTVVPFIVDGAPNPAFKYEGEWTVNTTTIYNDNAAVNVTELVCPDGNNSRFANVTMSIPAHTSYIIINGTIGPGSFAPSCTWDPKPPGVTDAEIRGFNASSPWTSGQIQYVQRLDPDTNYTLQLHGARRGYVKFHTASFYSANGTSAHAAADGGSSVSTGTIVGAVIGSVAGAAILAALAFYFCFWRPRKRRDREEEAALSRDNAGFVPFGQDTNSSAHHSIVQETDAGTLPPEYNPQWSGTEMRTAGAPSSPISGRAGTGTGTSTSNSTTTGSGMSSLAAYKLPYVTGSYVDADRRSNAQDTPPRSAVSQVADYKLPFINGVGSSTAGLPPGAAAPGESPASGSEPSSMRRLGSTEKLVAVRPSESRPLPEPPR